jgi:hypothetical protein
VSQGSFRGLAQIIRTQDFICGDKFLEFSRKQDGVTYSKTDFVYRSGAWRGKPVGALFSQASKLHGEILILGHSSLKISKNTSRLLAYLKGVKKIYGTNLYPVSEIAEVLPLGVTNNSGESELHEVLGNSDHFFHADTITENVERGFSVSFYANFTAANNFQVRGKLSHILSHLPGTYSISRETPMMTDVGRTNYLARLRKSSFVLCPEGTGPDTHRLWETLYMGGVPIVTSSKYLNLLYSQFPVVVIDSWSDLEDSTTLERKWHEVQRFEWDDSLLGQAYWLNEISMDMKNG